jgi:hypothetical protein
LFCLLYDSIYASRILPLFLVSVKMVDEIH